MFSTEKSCFDSWQRKKNFSIVQSIQTNSETHPASYSMDMSSYFPRSKALGHEDDHSPPSNVKIKDG